MKVEEVVAVRSHTRRRASTGSNTNKDKATKFTDTSYTPQSKYKPFNKPTNKPTPFNKPKSKDLS
jgi:hypothetical protein